MEVGSHYLFNRRILIRGGVLLLIVAAVILTVSLFLNKTTNTKKENEDSPNTSLRDQNAQKVFIKDFYTYDNTIGLEARKFIERKIYTNITGDKGLGHSHEAGQDNSSQTISNSENMHDLYTGVVRKGSFSKNLSGNTHTIRLLIDVEPNSMTYEVKIVEQDIDGHKSKSIHISCAPKSVAMDSSVQCTGGDI